MRAHRQPRPGDVTGFVVGKFLPPHLGHGHLLRAAQAGCDHLDVFAVWRPEEPIPAHLRADWLRELAPGAVVHSIADTVGPDDPHEWADNVHRILGRAPDVVFTSEGYGDAFAAALGARHVSVDPKRSVMPTSATAVRADPYGSWPMLPAAVRAWFAVRVAVVGAESTGGTTLARALAEHYRTEWVPEVGRAWTDRKLAEEGSAEHWDTPEFVAIARQQATDEDAAARRGGPVLVCDTDALATGIWHERYVGSRCPEVERFAAERPYDLYLLTGDEIAWEDDGTRDGPHLRAWMTDRFREELARRPEPVLEVRGPHEQRLAAAVATIDALLAAPWTNRHRIRATNAHHPEEAPMVTTPDPTAASISPLVAETVAKRATDETTPPTAADASAEPASGERWAVGVVDVQNDFCEGGSLAVVGGAAVAGRIRRWLEDGDDQDGLGDGGRWVARFATADRHPAGLAGHFAAAGTEPDFANSWPAHCVAGTPGAELHPDLLQGCSQADLFDTILEKGQASAAYSGFEGHTVDGATLTEWLHERDVTGVELCGIATDHCVRATAADALAAGFRVRLVTDLCAGIDDGAVATALADLAAAGAEITTTADLDGEGASSR